ncbi:MAG: hypothetical protein WAU01_12085 [Saprospiraceae bacterium]
MLKCFLLAFLFCCQSYGSSCRDSITVYIFLLDECRICQEIAPELNAIYTEYKDNFAFQGLFPNFISKKPGIEIFKQKYHIDFPLKTDYFKSMAKKLHATVLPEVIIYNESKDKVLYQGAINDLFISPGKRRHSVSHHYLRDALQALATGKGEFIASSSPVGCFINFNDFNN